MSGNLINVREVDTIQLLTTRSIKVRGKDKVIKTEAKFVRRRVAVGLIFLALIVWALDATTPEMCKVPTEQMNQFCLDLLYP